MAPFSFSCWGACPGDGSHPSVEPSDEAFREEPLHTGALPSKRFSFSGAPDGRTVVLVAFGAYSPPTVSHLRMMEEARDAMVAKGFYVAGGVLSPVHQMYNKRNLVPMHHRLRMISLAVKDSDWLDVDSWECTQASYTPTARVLDTHFQPAISELSPDARAVLVCGADQFESFLHKNADGTPLWSLRDQEIILGRCGVVVMGRENINLEEIIEQSPIFKRHRDNIVTFTPMVVNNISSTVIRKLLRENKSVKYLLHDHVQAYIYQHNLANSEAWADRE
eukprot:NODE_14392_length_1111_cov_12.131098.p1 GENE.NODE_14392_length_1111_cov_12.131098~~NODE_14392_length_1111_cov_12.131098.p1  ORF type:complete len:322 (+),score=55.36 NODE_14392_length_1111_cov_12.131098:133-966(+)